jgi:hypothetical protein
MQALERAGWRTHLHDHLSETGLDGPRLPVTVSPRLYSFLSDGELDRVRRVRRSAEDEGDGHGE